MSQMSVYVWDVYKLHCSEAEVKYEHREADRNAVIEQQILHSVWLLWALAGLGLMGRGANWG